VFGFAGVVLIVAPGGNHGSPEASKWFLLALRARSGSDRDSDRYRHKRRLPCAVPGDMRPAGPVFFAQFRRGMGRGHLRRAAFALPGSRHVPDVRRLFLSGYRGPTALPDV
jgi:hypothetical protein